MCVLGSGSSVKKKIQVLVILFQDIRTKLIKCSKYWLMARGNWLDENWERE